MHVAAIRVRLVLFVFRLSPLWQSPQTEGKNVGRSAGKILQLLQMNPQITIQEIAIRLRVMESAVEKQIRNLREQEIIGRIGPAKGGHWEILE